MTYVACLLSIIQYLPLVLSFVSFSCSSLASFLVLLLFLTLTSPSSCTFPLLGCQYPCHPGLEGGNLGGWYPWYPGGYPGNPEGGVPEGALGGSPGI